MAGWRAHRTSSLAQVTKDVSRVIRSLTLQTYLYLAHCVLPKDPILPSGISLSPVITFGSQLSVPLSILHNLQGVHFYRLHFYYSLCAWSAILHGCFQRAWFSPQYFISVNTDYNCVFSVFQRDQTVIAADWMSRRRYCGVGKVVACKPAWIQMWSGSISQINLRLYYLIYSA